MNSILISIQPKWCNLIASGRKTLEIRKTKPKLKPPFKCYIYCTKAKEYFSIGGGLYATNDTLYRLPAGEIKIGDGFELMGNWDGQYDKNCFLNGKVIGEFICDGFLSHCEMANADIAEQQGLIKRETLLQYADGKELYGWHISGLTIYNKPKELSEFFAVDNPSVQNCEHRQITGQPEYKTAHGGWIKGSHVCNKNGEPDWCTRCKTKPITKAPQSWCYVSEAKKRKED